MEALVELFIVHAEIMTTAFYSLIEAGYEAVLLDKRVRIINVMI